MISVFLAFIDDESDQELFINLYSQYEKQMWLVARRILNDEFLAEDATHNAFCRIANNITTLRKLSEGAKRKYVLTAAKNAALDMIKKEQKATTVNLDSFYNLQDEKASNEIKNFGNENYIIQLLNQLPQKYLDVMYMHFVLEMTEKEIAQILDRKINAVRQQVLRGRKMFAELYEKEMNRK